MKIIDGNYSDSQEFKLGEGMSAVCVLLDNAGMSKEFFVLSKNQAMEMKKALEGQL